MRFPSLCSPWNASVLFSLHGIKSQRHVFSWPGAFDAIDVVVRSNQSALIAMRNHFASSGLVLVWSCFSVFAVMVTRASSIVDSAQCARKATSADFPEPWPETVAS